VGSTPKIIPLPTASPSMLLSITREGAPCSRRDGSRRNAWMWRSPLMPPWGAGRRQSRAGSSPVTGSSVPAKPKGLLMPLRVPLQAAPCTQQRPFLSRDRGFPEHQIGTPTMGTHTTGTPALGWESALVPGCVSGSLITLRCHFGPPASTPQSHERPPRCGRLRAAPPATHALLHEDLARARSSSGSPAPALPRRPGSARSESRDRRAKRPA